MKKRIFSILLTLAMVLSLLPAAAFAEGEAVAKVGETEYATLADAVANVPDGGTVTLLKDYEVPKTIVVTKPVTLDLGGNILSENGAGYVIAVGGNGDLTLKNGTISITGNQEDQSAIYIDTTCTSVEGNNNVVIEKDVTIQAKDSYGIAILGNKGASKATLTVRGKIEAKCAAVSGNGTYWGTDITIDDGAELTSTDSVAIYHPQKGTLTIKGATITGKGGIEAKSGDSVVTVENATITATAEPDHSASSSGTSTEGYAVAVVENSAYQGAPTFTINNGSFYGPIALLEDNQVAPDKAGSITVNGGSFTDLVGAVKYAAPGAEIKLLDDVTVDSRLIVDKALTIDLGGKTLSQEQVDDFVLVVAGNGDLTLKNGTVLGNPSKDNRSAIKLDCTETKTAGNAKLLIAADVVVKNTNGYGVSLFGNQDANTAYLTVQGKIEAKNAAISGNGTWNGTEIVVDDGAELISTESVAIYHPQKGTLTIKGATITGLGGVEAKAGESVVTVENATITATGTPTHEPNDNGPSTSGYAVAVVENENYFGNPTFEIKNGTINGKIAVLKDDEVGESDKGEITVSGGKFSESVDPELLADGLTAELVYSEGENKRVYTYYPTLEDALAAAEGTEGTVNDLKAAKDKECRVTLVSGLNRASTWLWTQQGSSFTLPQLEKGASQVHVGWKDEAGTYYAVGAVYTVPAKESVELTAVWQSTDIITPVGPSKPTEPSEPSEPTEPAFPFTDVTENDWFYDGVKYVSDKGLMNGTGENTFAPKADTTRGMIVTILARMEGVDTTKGDTWYAAGREWAMANGVSDGTNMEGKITREQLAAMLYRYAQSKGYDVSAAADLSTYADGASVSSWALDAMQWAVGSGLMQGSGNSLNPQANATRAEVAAILMRFAQNLAK